MATMIMGSANPLTSVQQDAQLLL